MVAVTMIEGDTAGTMKRARTNMRPWPQAVLQGAPRLALSPTIATLATVTGRRAGQVARRGGVVRSMTAVVQEPPPGRTMTAWPGLQGGRMRGQRPSRTGAASITDVAAPSRRPLRIMGTAKATTATRAFRIGRMSGLRRRRIGVASTKRSIAKALVTTAWRALLTGRISGQTRRRIGVASTKVKAAIVLLSVASSQSWR